MAPIGASAGASQAQPAHACRSTTAVPYTALRQPIVMRPSEPSTAVGGTLASEPGARPNQPDQLPFGATCHVCDSSLPDVPKTSSRPSWLAAMDTGPWPWDASAYHQPTNPHPAHCCHVWTSHPSAWRVT